MLPFVDFTTEVKFNIDLIYKVNLPSDSGMHHTTVSANAFWGVAQRL